MSALDAARPVNSKQEISRIPIRMGQSLASQVRSTTRFSAFFAATLAGLWDHRNLPRNATRRDCAEWLHEVCIRGLRAIHLEREIRGPLPQRGLIVSNHLSYLDILCLSASVPCVFVSKAEVQQWPFFGRYAQWSGSVFVQRQQRGDAARANTDVAASMKNGVPVVLFPEGTTSAGHRVNRFHSTMLQPAIDVSAPITPCAIRYELDDGDAGSEVCWWGEMTLMPHVWKMMGKRQIRAKIAFGEPVVASGDRKELGHALHDQVARLHESLGAER